MNVPGKIQMPVIANPTYTQDYNSYSYVRNNPLGWVDPSGYIVISAAVRARAEDLMERSGDYGATWTNSGGGNFVMTQQFNSDNEAFQAGFSQAYGFNCPLSISGYRRMANLNGLYSNGSGKRLKVSFSGISIGLVRIVKGFQRRNKLQFMPRFNLGISFSFVEGETEGDNSGIEKYDLGSDQFFKEIVSALPNIKRGKDWGAIWNFNGIDRNFDKYAGFQQRGYRWIHQQGGSVYIDIWEPQHKQTARVRSFKSQLNLKSISSDYRPSKSDFTNKSLVYNGVSYKYVLTITGIIKAGETSQGAILMNICLNDWNTYEYLLNLITK